MGFNNDEGLGWGVGTGLRSWKLVVIYETTSDLHVRARHLYSSEIGYPLAYFVLSLKCQFELRDEAQDTY